MLFIEIMAKLLIASLVLIIGFLILRYLWKQVEKEPWNDISIYGRMSKKETNYTKLSIIVDYAGKMAITSLLVMLIIIIIFEN